MWSLRYALEAAVPSARSSHVTLLYGLIWHQDSPTSTGGTTGHISPDPRGPQGPLSLLRNSRARESMVTSSPVSGWA